ncbi:hypothetical protein KT71_002293 [Congregibacter litoralis KT71]|uniref:Uncharacterized protein n=1 Tax=Congregibacter litoralis KT71 TaxID=314285 RepID=V7HS87_9GAMM|nr:hypothetical protein KT71_002293 [Congregibacter litoralis KT71]
MTRFGTPLRFECAAVDGVSMKRMAQITTALSAITPKEISL